MADVLTPQELAVLLLLTVALLVIVGAAVVGAARHDPGFNDDIVRFRRRFLTAVLIFFGGIPILMFLATTYPSSDEIRVAAIVAWLAASILAFRRVGSFQCPGCGKRFRTDWYVAAVWPTKTCQSCGYSLRGKL